MAVLVGLMVREAGKSLRQRAWRGAGGGGFPARTTRRRRCGRLDAARAPLGPVVCISPWNFPLAIFTGQVAAALAAGNTVLAKPAEETPLVAAEAVRVLHAAGVPRDVLQFVPGGGEVGAALVADARVQGVMFTGSTEVARLIQRQLAGRLTPAAQPVPLIAETGGQNAMVVDSSALAEQVVADVIVSAFDSAPGSAARRCGSCACRRMSADRVLRDAEGRGAGAGGGRSGPAVHRCRPGDLGRGAGRDRGPCRDDAAAGPRGGGAAAAAGERRTARSWRRRSSRSGGWPMWSARCSGRCCTCCGIGARRWTACSRRSTATGYGLTFGLHTRIDETVARVLGRVAAGNVYVNRNMIGAVVGVQPFGGTGLSGTGPKAGGPLYLGRLVARPLSALPGLAGDGPALEAARSYAGWLRMQGHAAEAAVCEGFVARSALGAMVDLPGPVGERNVYSVRPRGRVAALARTVPGLLVQVGAILATGNLALVDADNPALAALAGPAGVRTVEDAVAEAGLGAVLFEGEEAGLRAVCERVAGRPGRIVQVQAFSAGVGYDLDRLVEECSVSTNVAAAGGNASLMAIDAAPALAAE